MKTNQAVSTKILVIMALFIAMSFVGSFIRIFGTIAFDSLPGFLAALLLGPVYGAVVGFLGHFFTALNSGFPLSLPLHIVIAASMALTMYVYGFAYRALKRRLSEKVTLVLTGMVGVFFNAPVSLAMSMAALFFMAGREVALGLLALLPFLLLAAAANVLISIILFKALGKVWEKAI